MAKLGVSWLLVFAGFASVTFGEENPIFPGTKPSDEWWSNSIIYQVYPRSFKDSNGDGIGDLKGITQSLDYFVDLGVNIVWINPIFKSPMDDFGFDVENYTEIDPIFGTMSDFEELISEMDHKGLKLVMEFVPNHSSSKCEWFSKSIKREGKYEDYYEWHNASNQDQLGNQSVVPKPPNNWLSYWGGSAWSWNDERKQFYLHQFSDRQPDFNFRNPEVHKELFNIMEFWMDKGVAGFRFNAVGVLYENKDLLDEPLRPGRESWPPYYRLHHVYTHDQPEVIGTVLEWRKFMDDYSKRKNTFPRLLAAESDSHVCVHSLSPYYGNATNPGAQVPFNFHLMIITHKDRLVNSVDFGIQFWFEVVPKNSTPNWVIESLDTDRISSKYGREMVQVFTALKLALPGIDITYYGSEIGMENIDVRPDQVQDSYNSSGLRNIASRDFARSPMQWNNEINAGFTTNKKSWLPVNPNYYKLNVESQKHIPTSNLNFYKKMSRLRKTDKLKYGDLSTYKISDSVYMIERSLAGHGKCLVVMNFGSETETIVLARAVKNIEENLFVYLGSENSAYTEGNIVPTRPTADGPFRLRPKSVVVLTSDAADVDPSRSNANSHNQNISFSFIGLSCILLLSSVYAGMFNS